MISIKNSIWTTPYNFWISHFNFHLEKAHRCSSHSTSLPGSIRLKDFSSMWSHKISFSYFLLHVGSGGFFFLFCWTLRCSICSKSYMMMIEKNARKKYKRRELLSSSSSGNEISKLSVYLRIWALRLSNLQGQSWWRVVASVAATTALGFVC